MIFPSYYRRKMRALSVASLLAVAFVFFVATADSFARSTVVPIGDSLTAEYDTIPDIPGFPSLPTDYAKITVRGWESMSWVEVLGRLRGKYVNFGGYKKLPDLWSIPRMSGYELNWGIPGINVLQYQTFLNTSFAASPAYFALRQPLENELRDEADYVVIWLGGNDFRAAYGALYSGASSAGFVAGVVANLSSIIDYVQRKNSGVKIVIANIPDLGATPSKKTAHPDPAGRAIVTAVTEETNRRIAQLAAAKHVVVADVFSQTERLVQNAQSYFGAVAIINDKDPNNDPHYHFTRDGLHPNTPSQIEIARVIVDAMRRGYGAGIPQITDAEALLLLHINPNEPYLDWLGDYNVTLRAFTADPDVDGLSNLAEYAFGLNPSLADALQLPVTLGGPVPGFNGSVSINYRPDPAHRRLVRVVPQFSIDSLRWFNVPAANIVRKNDGSFTAVIPPTTGVAHLRLRVSIIRPSGSKVTTPPPTTILSVGP